MPPLTWLRAVSGSTIRARVVHRDDVRHAHDSRLGVDFDFGELASRLVGAKAAVVRHALALRGNRIAGNSLAHVVK